MAAAIFAVCCLAPVGYLLVTSVGGLSRAASALALDPRQRSLLATTALLGLGTAMLSTAIGAPLGLFLARMPLRRKAAVRLWLAAPLLLPPYVVALSWILVGTEVGLLTRLVELDVLLSWTYSLPAAVVVLSLVLYPVPMLASETGLRHIDGRLEEAGLVVASPGRVLRRITLPLAAPHIVAAALVVFVLAVSDFGVPAMLRVRVYTTEVFTAFAALYDFSQAIVLAVPLLLLCAVVAAVAARLLAGRFVSARRLTGTHPALFRDRWRGAGVAIAATIAFALALPVAVLLRESSSVRSARAALSGSGEAIANSLLLAAAGATLIVAVAVWLGHTRARVRGWVGSGVDTLLVVLFAVPSTIVGVGLIGVWNRQGMFGTVYGTDWMFLLVYAARFLPVAALMLAAAVQSIPVSHEEAAAAAGAGWLRTMRWIVLPQLRLPLAAAWIVVFVLCFGELGASILIAPPGESTLPIRVYTMIANAPPAQVATLALLQTAVILTPLGVLGMLASSREGR